MKNEKKNNNEVEEMKQRVLFQGLKLDKKDELILHAFVLNQTILRTICSHFNCSACCEVSEAISLFPSDIRNIKRYLGKISYKTLITLKNGIWSIKNLKPCQFLKDKHCSIYKVRPEVCYGFPFTNSQFYRPNSPLAPKSGGKLVLITAPYCFASLIFHRLFLNITSSDLLIDTTDQEACVRFAMETVAPYLNISIIEEIRHEIEQKEKDKLFEI